MNSPGRTGAFTIPYFLTFDRGLASLFSEYPQRSCLISNNPEFPQFFGDINVVDWLKEFFGEDYDSITPYFTPEGIEQRSRRLEISAPSDIEQHVKVVEKSILSHY